jgi:hypothetical protein
MPNHSSRFADLALEMGWSLWGELGVSTWIRHHQYEAVDVEPLILLSAWLGRFDRRLFLEAVDWCVLNHKCVSTARLRRLVQQAQPQVLAAYNQFATIVNQHDPRAGFPSEGMGEEVQLSGKSSPPDLNRAALLQLRLRALFGTGARADVLRLLTIHPTRRWPASELARQAGYSKVQVSDVLEQLASTATVGVEVSGNQHLYFLKRNEELLKLVGPMPAIQPDFKSRFEVLPTLIEVGDWDPASSPMLRSVEAVSVLRRIEAPLADLGLLSVVPRPPGPDFGAAFDRWLQQLLRGWAGLEQEPMTGEFTYHVHRLESGDFTFAASSDLSVGSLLFLPGRSQNVIEDDSVGAPALAHELLNQAYLRTGVTSEPFQYQSETFVFAKVYLRSISRGGSRVFGESFLRSWRAEFLARFGTQFPQVPRKIRPSRSSGIQEPGRTKDSRTFTDSI